MPHGALRICMYACTYRNWSPSSHRPDLSFKGSHGKENKRAHGCHNRCCILEIEGGKCTHAPLERQNGLLRPDPPRLWRTRNESHLQRAAWEGLGKDILVIEKNFVDSRSSSTIRRPFPRCKTMSSTSESSDLALECHSTGLPVSFLCPVCQILQYLLRMREYDFEAVLICKTCRGRQQHAYYQWKKSSFVF